LGVALAHEKSANLSVALTELDDAATAAVPGFDHLSIFFLQVGEVWQQDSFVSFFQLVSQSWNDFYTVIVHHNVTPILFANEEGVTLVLRIGFENELGFLVESHTVGTNVLVFELQFHELLLIDGVANMEIRVVKNV
jgi:hypothetical protein